MLRVEGVTSGYGQAPVLHDVSVEVAAGESVALLGLNGAGKSTLLQCIAGLHPVRGGSVVFDDRDVTGEPGHRRLRRGLALVAESRELFPSLTVQENLYAALTTTRLSRAQARERVEAATAWFPVLEEKSGQLAGLLSGGQQQMLAIARALVGQPTLLLLDEPSLGLAPVLVSEIYDRLSDMRDAGISMLIVEQHVHEVMKLCDRMYVMELGVITRAGRTTELTSDAEFARAYLGH